jgi:hypothetical protein
MDDRDRAAIEPVAREIEIRPEAGFEAQDFLVKVAGRIEIVGLDRDMVQRVDRNGGVSSAVGSPERKYISISRSRLQPPATPDADPVLASAGRQC